MNVLTYFNRKFQNKYEVKFLQAWLNQFEDANLSVDGDYGEKTKNAVTLYQKKNNLYVDGKCGPQTQKKMGFLQSKNKNIVLLEIPFDKLYDVSVLVRDKQGYTCEKFAKEGNFDIVINGAFFQLSTRKIVQLVARNGVVDSWGMGKRGIAFTKPWSKAFPTLIDNVVGKPFDLQGGAPFLIRDYKIDIEGINNFNNNGIMRSKTKRNCLGVTDNSFILMFTIGPCTLYDMANEAIHQRIKTVIGCDGGGSQSLYMGGAWVFTTDGRLIPAAIGFKVK